MSSQTGAKRAVPAEPKVSDPVPDDGQTFAERLRIWKQVVLGEMLNLLERRRYDLKASR